VITRAQLGVQIDRLVDTYGDKAFSDQRVHLIWEAVEHLDYANVITLVDAFIRSEKNPPLPADFATAAREFRPQGKRYALGEIQPREIARCWDCGDSGFLQFTNQRCSGSCPCHCIRGEQLIEAGKRMRSPTDFGPQYRDEWGWQKHPEYKQGEA
jgi:hypothetical protein